MSDSYWLQGNLFKDCELCKTMISEGEAEQYSNLCKDCYHEHYCSACDKGVKNTEWHTYVNGTFVCNYCHINGKGRNV